MNISQSEQNSSYDSTAYNDNKLLGRPVESPRHISLTPKGVVKAFSRKSWHTDVLFRESDRSLQPQSPSISEHNSARASSTIGRSIPPTDSPCSSVSTIHRIVAPNMLSPVTPGNSKSKISLLPPTPVLLSPSDSSGRKRAPNLLGKISMAKNAIKDVNIPSLYKFARKCLWKDFAKCLENSSDRDITYVYKKDGTTIMHMIVMSRTGYIDAFKSSSSDFDEAPLELLEVLLQRYPDLATVPCSLNGYTPLTYACLVCNDRYDVENAATMVRLFLKFCPESIHVFTKDGLSAVDIHVVSYSHHHQEKEDSTRLGRTSATVLRTLLTHSPALANNRLDGDKIRGPIELLYKCNSKAFTEALLDDDNDWEEEDETITSEFTVPHKRQEVLDRVSKWWIWTWTVMILKYGSLKQKKRGAPFAAVHAAAMQLACPAPVLSIAIYTFPRQVKQSVQDKDSLDNLPLHAVCSWPLGYINHTTTQALCVARKSQAITKLLEEYPMAIKVTNCRGETALELAAKSGTTWEGGVRRLVKAYPKALRLQSKQTGLYPFMMAACAVDASTSEERNAQALRTIYGLLRSNPKVLTTAFQGIHR